jgi:hypothetical protein
LGLSGRERAAADAGGLTEGGFRALKVRLGYPDLEMDVAVVRAIRNAVDEGMQLMADYNPGLNVLEAIRRIKRLIMRPWYGWRRRYSRKILRVMRPCGGRGGRRFNAERTGGARGRWGKRYTRGHAIL